MNNQLTLSVSPHIHSGRTTRRIMLDVLIALLPAAVAGVVIFGLTSLIVIASCVVGCVGFEALFYAIRKKPIPVGDLSARTAPIRAASSGLPDFTPPPAPQHRGASSTNVSETERRRTLGCSLMC